mmetsp:Transcript_1111/g.3987  ORF Transcript_1111/g.3987 Transcript_1111/m.3987 type:complete len:227 (+) Transcript_1111:311-991(+)
MRRGRAPPARDRPHDARSPHQHPRKGILGHFRGHPFEAHRCVECGLHQLRAREGHGWSVWRPRAAVPSCAWPPGRGQGVGSGHEVVRLCCRGAEEAQPQDSAAAREGRTRAHQRHSVHHFHWQRVRGEGEDSAAHCGRCRSAVAGGPARLNVAVQPEDPCCAPALGPGQDCRTPEGSPQQRDLPFGDCTEPRGLRHRAGPLHPPLHAAGARRHTRHHRVRRRRSQH